MSKPVVYDVEIVHEVKDVPGGWDNPGAMGMSSCVIYDYETDRYEFFLHDMQRKDVVAYLTGRTVVSFNGVKFDSRVLLGNDRPLPNPWEDYDILLHVVRAKFGLPDVAAAEKKLGDRVVHDGSISLDGLGEGTLGFRKSGHGAHAPVLYQAGDYGNLLAYNLNDVRLTRRLYEFAWRYRYVVDRKGNRVRLTL